MGRDAYRALGRWNPFLSVQVCTLSWKPTRAHWQAVGSSGISLFPARATERTEGLSYKAGTGMFLCYLWIRLLRRTAEDLPNELPKKDSRFSSALRSSRDSRRPE